MLRQLFIPSGPVRYACDDGPKQSDTCFPNFGPDLLCPPLMSSRYRGLPSLCLSVVGSGHKVHLVVYG